MEILSDDQTPELAAAVHRITRQPMRQRMSQPRDLGETMVIAHAVVAAESGETVTVLIDDGEGARTATSKIRRLSLLPGQGAHRGSIRLVSTLTVLERAAAKRLIPDKAATHDVHVRLRGLDDGLPPMEKTGLLSPAHRP